jgi:hypothetical protein
VPQIDSLHSCICSNYHRNVSYKQVRKQRKPAHLRQEAFSRTQFLEVPRERHALPASLNVLWGNCNPEAVRIKEHSAPVCSEPAQPATCRDVGTLLFQRGHLESSQSWKRRQYFRSPGHSWFKVQHRRKHLLFHNVLQGRASVSCGGILKEVTPAALIEHSFLLACYEHDFVLAYLELDNASGISSVCLTDASTKCCHEGER